jgi:hypothetical protein
VQRYWIQPKLICLHTKKSYEMIKIFYFRKIKSEIYMNNNITPLNKYNTLVSKISETYEEGKRKAIHAVNNYITDTYWKVGEQIVEFEQEGKQRAEYGTNLMERLSRDLSLLHGKGFSLSNVKRMRQFYLEFPISATLSRQLTWSHYIELLKINDSLERSFYEKQAIHENWSIRELVRQKRASLFLRLASAKSKDEILQLAHKGKIVEKPEDIIREPFVLEFLHIPEPFHLRNRNWNKESLAACRVFCLNWEKVLLSSDDNTG